MKKIALLVLLPLLVFGQSKNIPLKTSSGFSKTSKYEYKQLDWNNINCTIASDGPFADFRKTYGSGLEWPKGSGKYAVFAAGLWIAGYHRPTQKIRTAAMEYTSEYQPGPLSEIFYTTTNDDSGPISRANDERYRLYKISKKDTLGEPGIDYKEWPGDLGAPYVDMNLNEQFDKDIDKPQLFGNQQIWCVFNDASKSKHRALSNTLPMGLEVQTLYFVIGNLQNTMFIKWKIINKSDADYDSVHIGIWSDVDLGNANDDLPGCDTSLNLGYVYNGDDEDEGSAGYGTKPPACGFQLLQGPIVPGGSNDSALFDWQWRKGFRNLPLSSFTFGTGYGEYDPFEYGPYYYGRLIGMLPIIYYYSYHYYMHLAFVIDSASGKPIKFFLTGDPLKPPSPTNPLPENFPLGRIYPQDIRILLSTGPFALSKGDTQEVCAAFLIAQGNDRLNSITQLKSYSKLVAYFFSKIELEKRILGKPTEETPTVYYICQNYPNPFNSSTSIRFQIPEDNDVTLKVYDIIGREVAVLVREKKKAGIHSATWNATSFPSSVYIFQLRAGGFVQARTMMLIR